MTNTKSSSWLKFLIAFIVCIGIRLLPPPFRAPNVEPVLATTMPFARSMGGIVGFLFAALSMIVFDLISGQVGQWTLITAATYGIIGAFAPIILRNFSSVRGYVLYAVVGTLFFDGVTGVLMGPLLFAQPWGEAFFGQIPFTLMHLVGNMAFAVTLSPLIETWIIKNSFFTLPAFSLRALGNK